MSPASRYVLRVEFTSPGESGHASWIFMHNRGQQDFTFTQLEDRAHVGLNYKFSQALTLRPELRFKKPSNIVAENTEAGMLIFGTIQ